MRFWDGPSFIEKASNFVVDTAIWAAAGFPLASADKQEGRLFVCEGCDRLELPTRICLECGCPVDEKAKRATSGCPLGKWPGETAKKGGCCGSAPNQMTVNIPTGPEVQPPS
jgi:ribosomal protein L32